MSLFQKIQAFLKSEKTVRRAKKGWTLFRPVAALLCAVLLVFGVFYGVGYYAYSHYVKPPAPRDQTMHQFRVKRGATLTQIANLLEEEGYVRNAKVFKYYVDLTDRTHYIKAGDYQLARCMTLEELIETLSFASPSAPVVSVRLGEGMTVEQMAEELKKKGLIENTTEFTKLCETGEAFEDFSFIRDLLEEKPTGRKYMLEGYLFPDTYEFYNDVTPEAIVRRLLFRFEQIYYNKDYPLRAEELGMSVDEVMILASTIEKEAGKLEDFAKVSAVFHNRLEQDMKLQSDATIAYVLGIKHLCLTDAEMAHQSPFNTYQNDGLPAGAICNPSSAAIEAALYPDEGFRSENYLYFCTGDPKENELVFAKTYEVHQANVKTYRPKWETWDSENT